MADATVRSRESGKILALRDNGDSTFSEVVAGTARRLSASFSRPANTTAYAVGDLVANNTSSGSVTPLSFSPGPLQCLAISATIRVNDASFGSGVTLRLHLFSSPPTVGVGDNGALAMGTPGSAQITGFNNYLGYIDVTIDQWFVGGAVGRGAPTYNIPISQADGVAIRGLIETRSIFTPASSSTFTVELGVVA